MKVYSSCGQPPPPPEVVDPGDVPVVPSELNMAPLEDSRTFEWPVEPVGLIRNLFEFLPTSPLRRTSGVGGVWCWLFDLDTPERWPLYGNRAARE